MNSESATRYTLGLDLGVSSIGWAAIETREDGTPIGILRTGSHIFEAGVDGGKLGAESAMTQGREQSKAVPRRNARSLRRLTWRRARRKKKLLGVLVRHGLLPEGDFRTPAAIDAYLKNLDETLLRQWNEGRTHREMQNTLYRLREACATREVSRHELGRALYHLAQRRGFLSNRKTPDRGEDRSEMKKQIGELAESIAAHEPPTLGSYLASLDPSDVRLRGRWTSRQMYLDEFDRIWSQQAAFHGLTNIQRRQIADAIFHQRPLKDQSHLLGKCSLIPTERRAPIALRIAQEFRVLQQVNHLRVMSDGFEDRELTPQERKTLVLLLMTEGDQSFTNAKKAIGLPPRKFTFSIERGGEKRLVGHRVDADLRKIFGDRWENLSEAEKDQVVEDVRSIRLEDALRRRGINRWGLHPDAAQEFGQLTFEEGYSAHSRSALARLLPHMRDGLSYSEARPESFKSGQPVDTLPVLHDWSKDLRNPSVVRGLSELRKVVNAIIRRYGKPDRVHIELARDLKAGRSKREEQSRRMRDREQERVLAAERITRDLGIHQPKRWQIEKLLLADECNWECPFTGKKISMQALLGSTPQFDVEHIWPFSRSLDDSYINKTLCYHEENRVRKSGHTPSEAYSGSPAQFADILERVKKFKGDAHLVRLKLSRFTDPIEPGFTARHLNETRYIALMAADYIGTLYGGRVDPLGRKRVITPTGAVTAWLRNGWGLNTILSDTSEKTRADHRHHAVDAIVVALAADRTIKMLADAAQRSEQLTQERLLKNLDEPWDDFRRHAEDAVGLVLVSRRPSRKVRGKLHDDTLLSKPHGEKRRIRKTIDRLTDKEIESGRIVDKRALAAIVAKLEELGESKPAKAFKSPENAPLVRGHDGRMVPLRKVRVEVGDKPTRYGKNHSERWANSAANHHVAFYDRRKPGGTVDRIAEVVTLTEAYRRVAAKQPVVDRSPRGEHEFAFSLCKGDFVMFHEGVGHERLCQILKFSDRPTVDIEFIEHNDARTSTERTKSRIRLGAAKIREATFAKVHVSCLGEISNAGG